MAEIKDLDPTDGNNTSIGGINSQGNTVPSNMDNILRAVAGMLARMNDGTAPLEDTFTLADPADPTKQGRFDMGNVTAGQRRVVTFPDADVDLSNIRAASTTQSGHSELATDAEAIAKTDTARVLTPSNLAALGGTATFAGLLELATDAETQTGTDTARAITPANLAARTATETRTGVVELATTAEVITGTDTARAVTPAGVAAKTIVDCISGVIVAPTDGDYRLVVKIPFGGTFTEAVTRASAGTGTATFKVNTTALGGTANSISTSEQAQAHASTNTFAADDDIVLTISSASSLANLSFTLKFTRALG